MRGRAKIRTNNSNSWKKGFEEMMRRKYTSQSIGLFLFLSTVLFLLCLALPLVLLTLPRPICPSAISHNQKYLFSLSGSISVSLFLLFPFLPSLCDSVDLSQSLPWPDFLSTLSRSRRKTKNSMFSFLLF